MATSGVPWKVDKQVIIDALKQAKGRLTYAARQLDVRYETLKKKIDADPELTEIVSLLRNDFEHTILDMAENCVAFAMSKQAEDPGNALKSAFYVLNSRGQERGWSNTLADSNKNQKIVFEVNYTNDSDPVQISPKDLPASDITCAE